MPLILLAALFSGIALTLASVDATLLRPLLSMAGAALLLAALAAPRARRAAFDVLTRFWPAWTALAALAACMAIGVGGARADPRDIGALFGFAFAAAGTAAIAQSYGRMSLAVGLLALVAPIALFSLIAGDQAHGPLGAGAPALDGPGFIASLGLLAVLAVHVAAEEVRQRARPGATLPPLGRRLLAPAACLAASFLALAFARAPVALGATAAAAAVYGAGFWFRARRSRPGAILAPAGASFAFALAALIVVLTGIFGDASAAPHVAVASMPRDWRGAALIAVALAGLGAVLAVSDDRGRKPSRGAALLAASTVYAAIVSWFAPGLAHPSAAFLFAGLIGLSASYHDVAQRTSDLD